MKVTGEFISELDLLFNQVWSNMNLSHQIGFVLSLTDSRMRDLGYTEEEIRVTEDAKKELLVCIDAMKALIELFGTSEQLGDTTSSNIIRTNTVEHHPLTETKILISIMKKHAFGELNAKTPSDIWERGKEMWRMLPKFNRIAFHSGVEFKSFEAHLCQLLNSGQLCSRNDVPNLIYIE